MPSVKLETEELAVEWINLGEYMFSLVNSHISYNISLKNVAHKNLIIYLVCVVVFKSVSKLLLSVKSCLSQISWSD